MKKLFTVALLAASIQAQAGSYGYGIDFPDPLGDMQRRDEVQQQINAAKSLELQRELDQSARDYANRVYQQGQDLHNRIMADPPRTQTYCMPTYNGGAVCY